MGFDGNRCKDILHDSQYYFVTIAITLGSGVLALPITLADSGFLPFLITIFISYIIQVLTLFFFTEVLQKAYYRSVDKLQKSNNDTVPIQLESHELSTYGSQSEDSLIAKPAYPSETIKQCLPNLHSLGELYLPSFLPYLSTLTIFGILVVYLISYTLAGTQSFAALCNASFFEVLPIFTWTLTVVLILFDPLITSIISILTLVKGVFFTATIILTFVAGVQNPLSVVNDFSATSDSFLMSLVALAAFVIAMPLMFSTVKQTKNGIIGYNIAIFLGLTTCLILNIFWSWSVLAIVPQHSVCLPNNNTKTIPVLFTLSNHSQDQCVKSPSLENAAENGEIATVPLSEILQSEQNPSALYISIFIDVFVAISVSVSFITLGSVLYHTLKGLIDSFWSSSSDSETNYGGIFKYVTVRLIREWFLALIIFTFIYAIASSNPKGFKVFVEQVGCLFISIAVGIFAPVMIYKATYSSEYRPYVVPFQLPRWFLPFQYLIPICYICAIIYNIYITVVFFTNN